MSFKIFYRRLKRFSTVCGYRIADCSAGSLRLGAAIPVRHWSCACSECWARDELTVTCVKCGHKLLCTTN